jgi:hypothetical protein
VEAELSETEADQNGLANDSNRSEEGASVYHPNPHVNKENDSSMVKKEKKVEMQMQFHLKPRYTLQTEGEQKGTKREE